MKCIGCTNKPCNKLEWDRLPEDCPSRERAFHDECAAAYTGELQTLAVAADRMNYESCFQRCRLEELMEFCDNAGFRKIGLMHCIIFNREAGITAKILRANGFTVESVCCKCGSVEKSEMGLIKNDKVNKPYDVMCNPAEQAYLLDRCGVDFVFIMGLCVGHDTIAMKLLHAPSSTFFVKDRLLGHNPLPAIYMADNFYHDRLYPPGRKPGNLPYDV